MRLLDKQYLQTPFYGSRRMAAWLKHKEHAVNRKRVQRLLRVMGLEAISPKPRTTRESLENKVYPYLLRDVPITCPNQVWSIQPLIDADHLELVGRFRVCWRSPLPFKYYTNFRMFGMDTEQTDAEFKEIRRLLRQTAPG